MFEQISAFVDGSECTQTKQLQLSEEQKWREKDFQLMLGQFYDACDQLSIRQKSICDIIVCFKNLHFVFYKESPEGKDL